MRPIIEYLLSKQNTEYNIPKDIDVICEYFDNLGIPKWTREKREESKNWPIYYTVGNCDEKYQDSFYVTLSAKFDKHDYQLIDIDAGKDRDSVFYGLKFTVNLPFKGAMKIADLLIEEPTKEITYDVINKYK